LFHDILTAMFVGAMELSFDLAGLMMRTTAEWSESEGSIPAGSSMDFVVEELTIRGLRQFDDTGVAFDASASEGQFREAIIAGLNRWRTVSSAPKTPQEREAYYAFNEGSGGGRSAAISKPAPPPAPRPVIKPTWSDIIADHPWYTGLAILIALLALTALAQFSSH
jgi:hypothetical protein